MSVSSEYKLKKEVKRLKKEVETLEMQRALLRHDILERSTEFLNQTEVTFALVDFIFDGSEVRTLGEAQRKWEFFKKAVNDSESAQSAIDALGVDIIIHKDDNERTILDAWGESRIKGG